MLVYPPFTDYTPRTFPASFCLRSLRLGGVSRTSTGPLNVPFPCTLATDFLRLGSKLT